MHIHGSEYRYRFWVQWALGQAIGAAWALTSANAHFPAPEHFEDAAEESALTSTSLHPRSSFDQSRLRGS